MNFINIWIVIATIVFTLAAFSYPVAVPYYRAYRGTALIMAIFGWILIVAVIIFHVRL